MAEQETGTRVKPPEISPYVVSALLAGFGLWCAYDGWLNSSPEMQEHLTFNRVGAAVLLPWAAYDFWKVRKRDKEHAARRAAESAPTTEDPDS